jgi:hypothetical protein
MDTSAAIAALQEGEIDLAFVRSDQNVEGVHFEPLFKEVLAAVLPSGHKLATKKKIDLKDLAREPMVMFPREENPAYYDSIIIASVFVPHISQFGAYLTVVADSECLKSPRFPRPILKIRIECRFLAVEDGIEQVIESGHPCLAL